LLTYTISDGSNTYTQDIRANASFTNLLIAHSIVTVGGTLTLTVTPSLSATLAMSIDEYSFSPGATISIDGTPQWGYGYSGTAMTTPNLTPANSNDLIYGCLNSLAPSGGTLTPGSGFTARFNLASNPGSAWDGILSQDILSNPNSPIAVTATQAASDGWVIGGVAFMENLRSFQPIVICDPSQSRRRLWTE
jgi:hypothetical protein